MAAVLAQQGIVRGRVAGSLTTPTAASLGLVGGLGVLDLREKTAPRLGGRP